MRARARSVRAGKRSRRGDEDLSPVRPCRWWCCSRQRPCSSSQGSSWRANRRRRRRFALPGKSEQSDLERYVGHLQNGLHAQRNREERELGRRRANTAPEGCSALARVRGELAVSSETVAELASPGASAPADGRFLEPGGERTQRARGRSDGDESDEGRLQQDDAATAQDVVGKALISVLLNGKLVGTLEGACGEGRKQHHERVPIKWASEGGVGRVRHCCCGNPAWKQPGSLTVRAADDCGEGGGSSGGHFKIEGVKVDVLGVP